MKQYDFSNVSWDLWELVLELVHPYIKTPKIEKNQPCPCGSGKKYKAFR
ncbi:MAG TPA: hypothetical protein ENI35_03255 [Candidatus Desulfofervidus auxilii]|uniref:Uncharacterized protein n=1 Tax=Desulfofervidus auxilii TaxID=1621989 RepID=A0A7C2A8A9_DESA2|nr:hypothetical protein [Candidatus Desulfofervidus auxilii]